MSLQARSALLIQSQGSHKVERQLFWNTKHTTCSAVNSRQPETAAQHSGQFQEDNKCLRLEEICECTQATLHIHCHCVYDVPVIMSQ